MEKLPSHFQGLIGKDAANIADLVSSAGGVSVEHLNDYVKPNYVGSIGTSIGRYLSKGFGRKQDASIGLPTETGTKYVYFLDAEPAAGDTEHKPQKFVYYVDAREAATFTLGKFPDLLKNQIAELVGQGYTVNTYTADVNLTGNVANVRHHMVYDKQHSTGKLIPSSTIPIASSFLGFDYGFGKGGLGSGRGIR